MSNYQNFFLFFKILTFSLRRFISDSKLIFLFISEIHNQYFVTLNNKTAINLPGKS